MGQVLKREHGGRRAAFAALLTTGMLAALLALTGIAAPAPAYAADQLKGTGTADDPVLIYTTDDLIAWCDRLNAMGEVQERQQHARLMDHLVAPGPDGTVHGGAVTDDVIDEMNHPDLQAAELDGNGHAIELQLTSGEHGALFATGGQPGGTGTTKVKDLHFVGSTKHANVDRGDSAATLFETIGAEGDTSKDRQLKIEDCTNQASVWGDQASGGLIGSFFDNGTGSIVIERCANFGEIMSAEGHAGGIAGSIVQLGDTDRKGRVKYCTNDGLVKSMGGSFKSRFGHDGKSDNGSNDKLGGSAGGLVGYLSFTEGVGFGLGTSYNRGSIYSFSGIGYTGGLVGYLDTRYNSWVYVHSCYNKGSVQPNATTTQYAAGLFGHAVSTQIRESLTVTESAPWGSVSDTTRNGTLISSGEFSRGYATDYLNDDMYTGSKKLSGVGEGKNVTVTFIDPTDGYTFEESVEWNETTSLKTFSSKIEGYRFAYWTPDPPDEGGFWSNPPREFKSSDASDPGQRIYGGDVTLYAYYEPSVATVEFDLNRPDGTGYSCSMNPENGKKTVVKDEPVGALPTATCVNPKDKNDTRAFLGWATMKDGNDPKAEWISESSDNLYDYRDDENYTVTLYAQWAEASLPFEITRQPENCTVPAVAEGVSHEASFDFYTTYSTSPSYGYWAQLQYRKDRKSEYKNVENLRLSAAPNQFFFDLESSKQAEGDYRIKIEYYENGNTMGALYTGSANIVMGVPQSEAKVTSIALSEYTIFNDDSARDEVMDTESYDVKFKITNDSLQTLVGDKTGEFRHRVWIEGGPSNTSPGDDMYLDNELSGTLKYQHLKEGQTYTLCVSRRFYHSNIDGSGYKGESEPYRVPFTVPYADSIPAEIGRVLVTEEPVVENGVVLHWPSSDSNVNVNAPFNLASNVKYQHAQPDDRQVFAQWQYYVGKSGWIDVPDELFAKDEQGNPIRGVAWKSDRKEARAYATLNAEAKLNGAYFRVKLSTPPAAVDTISEKSYKELNVTVPEPEITNVEVTNDTHVKAEWEWKDASGRTVPTEGYYVNIERKEDSDNWVEVDRNRVYGNTYEVTLDPQHTQQEHRVYVRADTDGLKGSSAKQDFATSGKVGISWENEYAMCYLPGDHKSSTISVDYDWADYNDGKHVVQYTWMLSKEKYVDTAFYDFVTTETDEVRFPEDFESPDQPWDPREAQWVWVQAIVMNLDDEGNPTYGISETMRTSATLPVVHNTTKPQNLDVKDIGSHSVTVSWDAPAEGFTREYEVDLAGHKRIVRAEEGKTHYEATIDDLGGSISYDGLYVSTADSRKAKSTIATAQYNDGERIKTLPTPRVGTWTAAANVSEADLGDELKLSAVYTPESGKFPNGDVEVQWYSWREGDKDWQPEGEKVRYKGDGQSHTATLSHTVTSADYGRQWKLGVKASSPDESVTGGSNVVTVAIAPPAPTDVTCDAPTPASIPVSWMPVADAEGYQIKCAKLDADGNPVSATTYSAAASSLTPDDTGKLRYEVPNLEPDTAYRVSVAAFAHGVTSDFVAAPDVTTLPTPTIDAPVFSQVPKSVQVEAGKDATFTAQAGVGDGGAISYAWQHKGVSEQEFTAVEPGDKYAIATDPATGVTTLTVKGVGAEQVGAFRCVATNSNSGQTVSAASAAAYLAVTPVKPTDLKSRATSPTTGEVTWKANGEVRRFVVRYSRVKFNGKDVVEPERSMVVTIPDDAAEGACQLDGLEPNSEYSVLIDAAPQGGFIASGSQVGTSFTTPLASGLETATVSPDKELVEPGETVTFKVTTNVDGMLPEQLEYRWQRNAFGEAWVDVEGEDGAKKELSVTAPEGGSVDGYRCIVTSTRTTIGENGKVVGIDQKSVTSSTGLLLTSVPVAQPVQLAAEPDIVSVHLSWASNDVRPVTYQVQYAEGPKPSENDWITVDNVGSSTSCDVEGLKANTVYSWRVQAVVRDELQSEWAQADTFTTLEEPSALATVSVTPRWGEAVAGTPGNIVYTAMTNLDGVETDETLSYLWQESATGDEWKDIEEFSGTAAKFATYNAPTVNTKPRSCLYRCVVTASKGGDALKTITSEPVGFRTTAKPPTSLLAQDITAATADLSWEGSLVDGLSYRVFWRASGVAEWASSADLTEAKYTLNGLMPATTYEWYVQVMDNSEPSACSATSLFVTQSLSPIPQLTRVVVGPVDQTPSATEKAKLTAYTNVDDMLSTGATMTYKWEKRDLGSNPDDPNAWTTLEGKTARVIELGEGAVGYVRCTVTYAPPTSVFAQPLSNTSVISTNEARVRVMPAAPSGLTVSNMNQTTAAISWTQGASGVAFDLTYRAVGSSEWISARIDSGNALQLTDLKPGTVYEWAMRSVAYGDSAEQLCSDWVTGPPFTTLPEEIVFSRVEVTPSAKSVMVDTNRTIELTAKTDADSDHEQLTYQWQRLDGSDWVPVDGATDDALQVSAKGLSVGAHTYRCEVTATRGVKTKTLDSNESVVTVMPAAPTDLSVSDIHRLYPDDPNHTNVEATFHWAWDGAVGQQDEVQFELNYRKIAGDGASVEWKSVTFDYDESMAYVMSSLDDEDLTYQWRVRTVQNGVASPWSEVETFNTTLKERDNLDWVEVTPSDNLASATEAVTLKATTNVDGKVDPGTLAYAWEQCELTVDPRDKKTTWTTIANETADTITLPVDTNRYVRCKVTQTIDGVAGNPVDSNPARVRVEPKLPYDLSTSIYSNFSDNPGITLRWKCDDSRKTTDTVLGFDLSYRKVGASEWVEVPWKAGYHRGNGSYTLLPNYLEPDATYEWRVRTVLNDNIEGWKGGPHTEWVDGPRFTTPKVAATPMRAAAVIGNGRTLEFTAMPNTVVTNDSREKKYQWERKEGTSWVSVPDATSETLSIVANDATAAGTSRYRCKVSVGDAYNVYSSEVACTLAPAAPAGLAASGISSDGAELSWTWEKGGLSQADEFKVLYRESGARELTTATVAGNARELVLEGLKPETVYEWRVQAVQNGVESLPSFANLFVTASEHPALKLESVLVDPSDQAVEPNASATVKATTNLDGMVGEGELAYMWEKRALDSDLNDPHAWTKIVNETGSSVTLPVKTSGYVRCQVTYTADGSAPVASNEASVRVQPAGVPTGLEVKDIGDTTATFTWGGALPDGGSFTLLYRTAGADAWITVPKLTASPCTATDLAPNTKYEWRMCAVSADGVASAWVDGPAFTTTSPDGMLGSVVVAPERVDAVAGDSALVDDFLAKASGVGEGQSLAYQWQVQLAGTWTNLPGQTGERTHLSLANLEAGEYSLRCVVTATAPGGKSKTIESSEVTLALSPATPSGLDVREATRDTATLAWTWAGPGTVDSFNVRYREEGATDLDWVAVPAEKIDPASMTCTIEGLAPGTSYEWQVQAVQGGQVSKWAASGFVTQSGGSLKVARIWPPDVAVAADEQAKFAAFTNRGDADDVSYEWQYRSLGSPEDAWETIPNATGRILKLDANTTGYVRCVATQAPPSAGAAEVAGAAETPETPEVADVAEVAASNETLGMNEAPEANETNEPLAVTEADEAPETNEAPGTPEVAEVAETFAAPEPVVVVSNQARVRVTPSVPSSLAVGEVGFTDAALSWAAADVDGAAFSLAYRVAGSSEWTEITGLTVPACELDGLVQGASYEWRVQAVLGEGDDALASAWAYGESFTTQTMKAYQVTAGADGTWKPGQPGLAFAIDAPRDKFLSLAVDGAELALGTDYTVSDEGMTVTLSPDYLAKLAEGKHELTATFADGAASASFTVAPADPGPTPNPPSPTPPDPTPTPNPPTPNPPTPTPLPDSGGKALAPTGDPLTVALPLAGMLAAACAAAIALAAMRLRKRR